MSADGTVIVTNVGIDQADEIYEQRVELKPM
jgi:hypothetical protein